MPTPNIYIIWESLREQHLFEMEIFELYTVNIFTATFD